MARDYQYMGYTFRKTVQGDRDLYEIDGLKCAEKEPFLTSIAQVKDFIRAKQPTVDFRLLPRCTGDNPIARARRARGMTQKQLADVIGVKPQQVANWEQGLRNPKLPALMKLADALAVDLMSLVQK